MENAKMEHDESGSVGDGMSIFGRSIVDGRRRGKLRRRATHKVETYS